MCPFSLVDLIDAPGSFILGLDSRYFDLFEPPTNVVCVDLDTTKIHLSEDSQRIQQKILPSKPLDVLRNRLRQIMQDIEKLYIRINQNKTLLNYESKIKYKRVEQELDLQIRDAFLRFMACILNGYKTHLKPVTRRPDTKYKDRNI